MHTVVYDYQTFTLQRFVNEECHIARRSPVDRGESIAGRVEPGEK